MPDYPLVSIVIPCYNAEMYVREAIESALEQTYPNIEVIVIDDGSTDNSLEIVKSFGDGIRWETGENRGAAAARNRGLELADGEFIQFFDADDVLMPDKIERCLEAFTPDIDAVFCKNVFFGDHDLAPYPPPLIYRIARFMFPGSDKARREKMDINNQLIYLIRHSIQTPRPLHRASSVRRVGGFNEEIAYMDDYEFHFRLAIQGARFREIDKILVRCRRHNSPSRLTNVIQPLPIRLKGFTAIIDQIIENGMIDDTIVEAIAERFAYFARVYYRRGYNYDAIELYKTARKLTWFPRSTAGLVYDLLWLTLGMERVEKVYMRLRGIQPNPTPSPT